MKLRWKIAIGVAVLAIAGLGYAGNYFYDYAVVPSEKDFWKEIPLVRMKIRQEMNRRIGLQIQQIVRCGS